MDDKANCPAIECVYESSSNFRQDYSSIRLPIIVSIRVCELKQARRG